MFAGNFVVAAKLLIMRPFDLVTLNGVDCFRLCVAFGCYVCLYNNDSAPSLSTPQNWTASNFEISENICHRLNAINSTWNKHRWFAYERKIISVLNFVRCLWAQSNEIDLVEIKWMDRTKASSPKCFSSYQPTTQSEYVLRFNENTFTQSDTRCIYHPRYKHRTA